MLSRAETRLELAKIIRGALPWLAAVYHYKKADLGGQSPVVVIASHGALPQQLAADAYWTTYYFGISSFVLYSSQVEGWTEDQAEDQNDTLLEELVYTLFEHRVTEWWNSVVVLDRSYTSEVQIGGVNYLGEVMIVALEMKP